MVKLLLTPILYGGLYYKAKSNAVRENCSVIRLFRGVSYIVDKNNQGPYTVLYGKTFTNSITYNVVCMMILYLEEVTVSTQSLPNTL